MSDFKDIIKLFHDRTLHSAAVVLGFCIYCEQSSSIIIPKSTLFVKHIDALVKKTDRLVKLD